MHAGGDDIRSLGPYSTTRELQNARASLPTSRRAADDQDPPPNIPAWTPHTPRPVCRSDPIDDPGSPLLASTSGRTPPSKSKKRPRGSSRATDPPTLPDLSDAQVAASLQPHLDTYLSPTSTVVQRTAAIQHLSRLRRVTPATLPFLLSTSSARPPSHVLLPDCSHLDGPTLARHLGPCLTPSLSHLELRYAGQAVTDTVAQQLFISDGEGEAEMEAASTRNHTPPPCSSSPSLTHLTHLTLHGAYRLTDAGLTTLLMVAPELTHLSLSHCARISVAAVGQMLSRRLAHLDLSGCDGVDAAHLAPVLKPWAHSLISINLDGLPGVTDQVLVDLSHTVPRLSACSLARCRDPTAEGLATFLGQHPTPWREVTLSHVAGVTDDVLRQIETRELRVLGLEGCARLTDKGMASVVGKVWDGLTHLSLAAVGVGGWTVEAVVKRHRGEKPRVPIEEREEKGRNGHIPSSSSSLVSLDLSWCRSLTDDMCGLLVDTCPRLARLHLWGCTQLTTRFLEGHGRGDQLRISM